MPRVFGLAWAPERTWVTLSVLTRRPPPAPRGRTVSVLHDEAAADSAADSAPEPPADTDADREPAPAADDAPRTPTASGAVDASYLDEVAEHDTVVLGRGDESDDDPRVHIPAWEDIVFGVRRHR